MMRIAIVGAGALGLYYGSMLQRSGEEVHFLLRRDFEAIRQSGLQVYSINGDFHLDRVAAHQRPESIGPVDLVLVGLKTFANAAMTGLIEPLLAEDTAILTLQNGLGNEDFLASHFGTERILGGIAFLCSNRGEPGTVHHLGEGRIRLGEMTPELSDRAVKIAACFDKAGVPCEAVTDLLRTRWEKLVWNIPFNGLCALTNHDVTELLADKGCRSLVRDIMTEVINGANSQELQNPINGEEFIPNMIEATDRMDHYQPSMMIDRQQQRPLELEAIYSIPLENARGKGVKMDRVEMLYRLLKLNEPR